MGNSRVSIRTLPSGERAYHHPPDDRHPEGRLVLIRDRSVLKERHDANLSRHRAAQQVRHEAHLKRCAVKRELQLRGGIPPEKIRV